MTDLVTPTGVSTGTDPGVNPTPAGQSPLPVSPAQVPPVTPLPQQQTVDLAALTAQNNARVNSLMSEKDKALNAQNQAIAAQVELQNQLAQRQAELDNLKNNLAQTTQQAIDRATMLERENTQLKAENLKLNAILLKPHLAPYANFLTATSDPAVLEQNITQLEQVRNADLQRAGALNPPPVSTTIPGMTPVGGQPQQTQQQMQQNVLSLYNQRPAQVGQIPASAPSAMSPAGVLSPNQNIAQLLRTALNSGDPKAYQDALEQSKLLAQSQISAQLGISQ